MLPLSEHLSTIFHSLQVILISSRSTSQFLPVNLISSSLYFKFIPLRHCACVYTLAAHAEIINFLAPSRALAHGAFFFFCLFYLDSPLAVNLPLLQSPLLCTSLSDSPLTDKSHLVIYCWRPVSLWRRWSVRNPSRSRRGCSRA